MFAIHGLISVWRLHVATGDARAWYIICVLLLMIAETVVTIHKKKGQEWIDRAKESHLTRRDIWFLLDCQLWPKLGYGIGCVSTPRKTLERCLGKIWWQLIPMGGIIRSTPREVRHMSKGFYAAGGPHPGVECLVQQVNKIQTHYGCKKNIGLKMNAILELLVVEVGVSAQPLQELFKKYKDWVTWTRLVSVWEKCDMVNVMV